MPVDFIAYLGLVYSPSRCDSFFLTRSEFPQHTKQASTDSDSCQGQEGPEDMLDVNLETEDEDESSTTSSVIEFDVEEEILIEQEMKEHSNEPAQLATEEEQAQGQYQLLCLINNRIKMMNCPRRWPFVTKHPAWLTRHLKVFMSSKPFLHPSHGAFQKAGHGERFTHWTKFSPSTVDLPPRKQQRLWSSRIHTADPSLPYSINAGEWLTLPIWI